MEETLIVDLEEEIIAALTERARSHGHSLDEEVRVILRDASEKPERLTDR